jgi:hypothetical protein
LKKLALLASAAVVTVCAVSLVATPADAKKHRYHKKPAATAGQMATGPGYGSSTNLPGGYANSPGYTYGGSGHDLGGPMKSGGMCWKDKDPWANTGQGYWGKC